MFGFFNDAETYKERLVAVDHVGEAVVDTVAVTDGVQPYETAVVHPLYNNGGWVVVEAYPTKAAAKKGRAGGDNGRRAA